MPLLSGIELVKIIKQYRRTPTILYTGADSKILRDNASEAGADAYLPSQVETLDYQTMINTIKTVLNPLKLNSVHDYPVTSLYESLNSHELGGDVTRIKEALKKIREHENYIRGVRENVERRLQAHSSQS